MPTLRQLLMAMLAALASISAHAATEAEVADLAKQAAGAMAPARAELERLANEGDALAAYYLGRLTLDGRGVPQNVPLAVEWFRKSANLGNADSAHFLGAIYD